MTRARDYLLLPDVKHKKRRTSSWYSLLAESAPGASWDRWSPPLLQDGQSTASYAGGQAPSDFAVFQARLLERMARIEAASVGRYRVVNPSEHAEVRAEEEERETAAVETEDGSDGEQARQTGLLVHDALERLAPGDESTVDEVLRALAREYPMAETDAARTMVAAALRSDIVQRAHAAEHRWKEIPIMRISDREGTEINRGYCDLVFTDGEDLVIVDYKTDRVQSRAEAQERAELLYRRQLEIYARAVAEGTGKRVRAAVLLFLRPTSGPLEIDLGITAVPETS